MNCVNPECRQVIEQGNKFCTKCGTPVRKEEPPREPLMPITPQETDPIRKPMPKIKRNISGPFLLFLVILVSMVVAGIVYLYYDEMPNKTVEGIKEGVANTGTGKDSPKGDGEVAAVVNGEKIFTRDFDQKLDIYKEKKMNETKTDFNSPEGKAAMVDMKKQVLNDMIQEKIMVTEASREKIIVSPHEIADKISAIKKNLNLSDSDFEAFLNNHAMTQANFEKRIEKDLLIAKLIAKGTEEKGLTKDEWVKALNERAKVEVLMK